jgi:GWxTD domain-containing protein
MLVFTSWRCMRSTPSVTKQNFATYYKPEEKVLRPKYVLYNVTDSMSRLYFSINSEDLLYAKNGTEPNFTARIVLAYTVHPVDFPRQIVDSGRVVMTDAGTPGDKKLLAASVDMDVIISGRYFLDVSFRDLNKLVVSHDLIYLDHRTGNAQNNFLITQAGSETPLFRSYVDSTEDFNLQYYQKQVSKLFVRYYKNKSGPAQPPYATEKANPAPKADSSWWIDISLRAPIRLRAEGFYRFSADTNSGGICVSRFHPGFPEINVAKQLLYPLRYLVTRNEYLQMDTAVNTKKAVDQFWLKCAGSTDRAREVIRNYYNRVAATNLLFTSEKEGWKTDRGMIYLIFGPPNNVYRNATGETWLYSPDFGGGNVVFNFTHSKNGFTDQEYILERNLEFKPNWIQAVDFWRQGQVYILH